MRYSSRSPFFRRGYMVVHYPKVKLKWDDIHSTAVLALLFHGIMILIFTLLAHHYVQKKIEFYQDVTLVQLHPPPPPPPPSHEMGNAGGGGGGGGGTRQIALAKVQMPTNPDETAPPAPVPTYTPPPTRPDAKRTVILDAPTAPTPDDAGTSVSGNSGTSDSDEGSGPGDGGGTGGGHGRGNGSGDGDGTGPGSGGGFGGGRGKGREPFADNILAYNKYDAPLTEPGRRPIYQALSHARSWRDLCNALDVPYEKILATDRMQPFLLESPYEDVASLGGFTGQTGIHSHVDSSGNCQASITVPSGNDQADQMALAMANGTKWLPALNYGTPVDTDVDYTIRFYAPGR